MRIAGLLLAAGAGRRFGGRKQLALIGDKPLVRCTLEALAAVLAGLAGQEVLDAFPIVVRDGMAVPHDGSSLGANPLPS